MSGTTRRAIPRHGIAVVFLALGVAAPDIRARQGPPQPTSTNELLRHANPVTPSGRGPFPVVMLVPGCSGFDDVRFVEQYRAHSATLLRAGFAVVRVDYLKARSVREACAARDAGTWEPRIAADIHQLARRLPAALNAAGSRLFLVGWSMGGGGVLAALSVNSSPAPFSGAVALYPSCRAVRPWGSGIRTLIMLAALDTIQPAAACESLVRSIGDPPSIAVRRFERAHHGFDIATAPVILEPRDTAIVAANPDAATQAWTEIVKFISGV